MQTAARVPSFARKEKIYPTGDYDDFEKSMLKNQLDPFRRADKTRENRKIDTPGRFNHSRPMYEIALTAETASFARILRKELSSGSPGGYAPHQQTPVIALILHCGVNGDHQSARFTETSDHIADFTAKADIRIAEKGKVHEKLLEIGKNCPELERFKDRGPIQYLQAVVERIMIHYRNSENPLAVRRAVKYYVLQETFITPREKRRVAFDVPGKLWREFADRTGRSAERDILRAMENHIKACCKAGGSGLRTLLGPLKTIIGQVKTEMETESSPKFVVLNVGEEAKSALEEAIGGDYEISLIAMLQSGFSENGD